MKIKKVKTINKIKQSGARKYINGKAIRKKLPAIKIMNGDFFSTMLIKRKHIS